MTNDMREYTITLDTEHGPVEVPRTSACKWTITFDTPDGPVEVPLTEELWDAYESDQRHDALYRAVRNHPRGAEIDRELQASHDRLAKLVGEKPLTPGEVHGVIRSRADLDPALAETLRAEEELTWALIREQTDIEITIGEAMETS